MSTKQEKYLLAAQRAEERFIAKALTELQKRPSCPAQVAALESQIMKAQSRIEALRAKAV